VGAQIMVVDDEPEMRQLISITLLRHGYAVSEADGGRQALAEIAQEPPDLVILDVMMPDLSGLHVIRQLKQNPETFSIPVIMLSAKCQEEDIAAMMQSGADACLPKPFSLRDLVHCVEQILSGQDIHAARG
jgi:two-component system, OmpR family, phosphate regulon response regulator PhoB